MNDSIPIKYIQMMADIARMYGCIAQSFYLESLIKSWDKDYIPTIERGDESAKNLQEISS